MSRILERLDELYAIGATRVGGSEEEDAAHRLAMQWMQAAGLELDVDAAGNLFGRRGDGDVWVGSHLDTVPNGGRFDGTLGVVCAIEIAARSDVPLTVVAFRDEERGCAGSSACVAAGGPLPKAFLEQHIEQGPVLARRGAPFGVVVGAFGQARGEVVFEGRADHAGTTPMDARQDALVAAAECVLRVRAAAVDGSVATVGQLSVHPGANNVVPDRVTLSIDARAATSAALDAMVESIGFQPVSRSRPTPMSGLPLEALRTAAGTAPEVVSGAGHDACVLATAGVPTGMLFVRSLNGGASHSPLELSSDDDILIATETFEAAVHEVVRRLGSPARDTGRPR